MQVTNPVGAMRSEMSFEERSRKLRVSWLRSLPTVRITFNGRLCLVRTHHFNVPCITLVDIASKQFSNAGYVEIVYSMLGMQYEGIIEVSRYWKQWDARRIIEERRTSYVTKNIYRLATIVTSPNRRTRAHLSGNGDMDEGVAAGYWFGQLCSNAYEFCLTKQRISTLHMYVFRCARVQPSKMGALLGDLHVAGSHEQ